MCSNRTEGMAGEQQSMRYLMKGGFHLNSSQNHTLDKFGFICSSKATARGIKSTFEKPK